MKAELSYCVDDITAKNILITKHYNENYLHEIRISLRKSKSLIYFFKDFISKEELEMINSFFRLLTSPTSKIRDYDVVKANYIRPIYLNNQHDTHFKTYFIHSINELHNLQESNISSISSREYLNTLAMLKSWVDEYQWERSSTPSSTKFLRNYIEKNLNDSITNIFLLAKNSRHLSRKKLHQLRIKIKEVRYIIEIFKFYINHYENSLGKLKQLQDILGDINDTYVADKIVKKLDISKHLSQQHRYIKKKIIKRRKSNLQKLKNQI